VPLWAEAAETESERGIPSRPYAKVRAATMGWVPWRLSCLAVDICHRFRQISATLQACSRGAFQPRPAVGLHGLEVMAALSSAKPQAGFSADMSCAAR
jgi:hypothetical protein